MKVNQESHYVPGNVLETLIRCKGYYKRPTGAPLVGYAGTYSVEEADGQKPKHFVGFEFYNCAKAEQYPFVRAKWAEEIRERWKKAYIPDVILGAPMGGILFADSLATAFQCRVVFAEKKVLKKAEVPGGRDETELVFDRHEIQPGDMVEIVEDVCNNFSTTKELTELISSCGGIVSGVICIVNRSPHTTFAGIDVTSLAHIQTEQFRQSDSEVAEDVAKGNVIWKPKRREEWAKLMKLMSAVKN